MLRTYVLPGHNIRFLLGYFLKEWGSTFDFKTASYSTREMQYSLVTDNDKSSCSCFVLNRICIPGRTTWDKQSRHVLRLGVCSIDEELNRTRLSCKHGGGGQTQR